MTISEAIEAMNHNVGTPGEAGAMLVLADVWEEHEANVEGGICPECHARLWLPEQKSGTACDACNGDGLAFVSNGNSLRAEYLRILAECGKMGISEHRMISSNGYWGHSDQTRGTAGTVPSDLFNAAKGLDSSNFGDVVAERLALMDAYAAADQPTRERWARETRALVPGVTCERCEGRGHLDLYSCPSCYLSGTPGRVPASTEATR